MKIRLAYGKKGLEVDVPEGGVTLVEPRFIPGLPDPQDAVREVLAHPLNSPRLSELTRPGERVAISICDSTRAMPSGTVLPALLSELEHLPDESIRILVATGTHRPTSPDELEIILGRRILERYRVINHVCTDENSLVSIGRTASGIPVILNRAWVESDIRITTGFVEPHFFAGFSGGPKMVAPGLAGLDTVMGIHSAALIADEKSAWGIIEDNPMHREIREIASMAGVHFSLDVTLNSLHEITSVQAGELFLVHERARAFTRAAAMQEVDGLFDVVITTNSGYPLDLNLYQAVKGLSCAARVVRPGGIIICAAECSDGIPAATDFADMISGMVNPGDFLRRLSDPGFRRQDQWQAQVLAQVLEKADVYLKSDGLSEEEIRSSPLRPVERIEDLLSKVLKDHPDFRICVLPEGPQTIPYVREGR